jgi:hypothetical protein
MLQSLFACMMLLIACTMLHYEVLRTLNSHLPSMRVPDRLKVVVVILGAFTAHLLEVLLYGATFYALVTWWGAGKLTGLAGSSWTTCLYFSAETYTSLGFGDLTPVGPVRMLVGTEALAGLLMIAWSASFTYLSMERFWRTEKG